ncbi:hypothetical protein A3H26_03350 [candidate division WWE3 bacterium RIFCSPLOWO2_12_FULL_36_10]|uniref:Uncharacterized protein n=1 Tax=candidate division WWE3 bacterium RIFCSPLOWO2_12_FULL_36_10 TaxID=1802630 RepID=A0A1F4VJ84_UNCKA|nr:MAG: hypothetical protein A3H26_03350 [candidate division WWE3 bacterium RIFCSPLOWO2_12_FULL_36_10]
MTKFIGSGSTALNELFWEDDKEEMMDKISIRSILSRSEKYTSEELGRAAIWHLLAETKALTDVSEFLATIDPEGGKVFRGVSEADEIKFRWEKEEKANLKRVLFFILNEVPEVGIEDFFITEGFLDRILHVSEGNVSLYLSEGAEGDAEGLNENLNLVKLALIGKEYALSVAEKLYRHNLNT